jgi:hypothetical protein
MADFVEEDPKKPRPAICACFKTMKRPPGQEVDILDEILGFGSIPDQIRGCAVEVIQMGHSDCFELVSIYILAEKQAISD